MADANLSAMLGTDAARLVHDALPRIEQKLAAGSKKAVVAIGFEFINRRGVVTVQVNAREQIQAPVLERKLMSDSRGQLSLFEKV